MVGWKGALLSMVGKIQHAKSLLQSILVYMASIFKIPTLVIERIDQINIWKDQMACSYWGIPQNDPLFRMI